MKRFYFLFALIILLSIDNAFAQTIVSGDVFGTWNLAGSPYIANDKCTVPNNQLLIIDPEVKIIIAENTSIEVFGKIEALGTPEQHIEITSPNDRIFWDHIYIQSHSQRPAGNAYWEAPPPGITPRDNCRYFARITPGIQARQIAGKTHEARKDFSLSVTFQG